MSGGESSSNKSADKKREVGAVDIVSNKVGIRATHWEIALISELMC